MTPPEIIEVERDAPVDKDGRWLLGMLEEGIYVHDATWGPDGRLLSLHAGPAVLRCYRQDGDCFPLAEFSGSEDWLPRLPERFNVVLGVQPHMVCDRLPGCARDRDVG